MPELRSPKRVITFVLEGHTKRKNPDFPVVFVSHTSRPVDKLPQTGWLAGLAVAVLKEGTSQASHRDKESLREAKKMVRRELSRRGFTVFSGGPRFVYVIQFKSSFREDADNTWLYVGETGRPIAERVKQHLSGGPKQARFWNHMSHRRPDLEPGIAYWSVEDSREAEKNWAVSLSQLGFKVRGPKGFESRGAKKSSARSSK